MSRPIEDRAERIVFAHELPDFQLAQHDASNADDSTPEERELERIAAIAAAASAGPATPPAALSARLAADALRHCAAVQRSREGSPVRRVTLVDDRAEPDGRGSVATETPAMPADQAPGFTTPRPGALGPLLAFAVGALAAGLLVWISLTGSYETSLAELRAQVLASDPSVRQKPWSPGPSELRGDVAGDVVWSQDRQDGWLTLRNLPALPADKAYQLWIVDGERTGDPVDGGVFRVDDSGETIVAIDAKLPIGQPKMFVITVEDRRGVVVSDQQHVVAIASL